MRRPVVVVPVRGLPIVALVLIGVIVAIARDARWGLMFCHVVGGGLWTAIDLFVGFVVGPIIGRMSIPARIEFSTRFMPKMLLIMPTVVTMTLAAGFPAATFSVLARLELGWPILALSAALLSWAGYSITTTLRSWNDPQVRVRVATTVSAG